MAALIVSTTLVLLIGYLIIDEIECGDQSIRSYFQRQLLGRVKR